MQKTIIFIWFYFRTKKTFKILCSNEKVAKNRKYVAVEQKQTVVEHQHKTVSKSISQSVLIL